MSASVASLRRENPNPVTRCYLGHKEYAQLRAMGGSHAVFTGWHFVVHGRRVYEVNEANHFHVC